MMITVSIVIPTKNRLEKLVELIHSIEASTYKNFEVIVVNDGGDTPTLLPKNVKGFDNDTTRGLAYSRSYGAKKAKGDYVLFIDDDNIIDKNMIKELVISLQKNSDLLAVGPLTFYKSNKKKIWFVGSKINLLTTIPAFKRSFTTNDIVNENLVITENLHNCFMIKKEFGDEVGWLDEKVFMNGTEFDLFQRIKRRHQDLYLATNVEAFCYHDVPEYSKNLLRSMGFDNKRRVYYFQRNRGLHVGRYGRWYERLSLFFIFYPTFLIGYSLLFFIKGKWEFLKEHVKATFAGYYYLVKG